MKNIILSVVFATSMLASYSQEKKENTKSEKQVVVPEAVKAAFVAKYAKVVKVKWSIEKPGEYEAEFDLNKVEMSVLLL